ncbi:amidase [Wilcoxina mikolae CBS 423.85]|nr:amidase [Wilcoxina mikolae CBS 423.85]
MACSTAPTDHDSLQPAIPTLGSSTLDSLVSKALSHRTASLSKVDPPIPTITKPLPLNVQGFPAQLLTTRELELTELDAPELIALMSTKKVTCEEVTRAFLRRAAVAQELVNCATELLWDIAISRARYLDSLPKPLGPLHGLPISLKEQTGFPTSIDVNATTNGGIVAWMGRKQEVLGRVTTAETIYDAGAVFYIRTNAPQTTMALEKDSYIYGRTLNPYNTDLTCGGSSGGEAALIALRGSVLGIGGDIGGSIRNPAGNCGVYGFKPTPLRVSTSGASYAIAGMEGIPSTRGPLSTTRSGLELFMKTYLDTKPWLTDTSLLPIPWRETTLSNPLRLGIMWTDGVVTPHPPVTRALKAIVETLKAAGGVEVSDWEPVDHDKAWKIAAKLYFEDGGKREKKILDVVNEPMMEMIKFVCENLDFGASTTEEIWDLKVKRDAYRRLYNDLWLERNVDAILCPYLPGAAPPHDTSKYWCYTSIWNFLEYPAVVFPTGHFVDPEVDKLGSYVPKNSYDEFNHSLWDPEKYRGAPLGMQIVTKRYEDEKCLKVLEAVEMAMGRN